MTAVEGVTAELLLARIEALEEDVAALRAEMEPAPVETRPWKEGS